MGNNWYVYYKNWQIKDKILLYVLIDLFHIYHSAYMIIVLLELIINPTKRKINIIFLVSYLIISIVIFIAHHKNVYFGIVLAIITIVF